MTDEEQEGTMKDDVRTIANLKMLGGTLERREDGWYWSDGTKEPRVEDLHPSSHYNFRIRTYHDGSYVEVPHQVAYENSDLSWVINAWDSNKLKEGISGDVRDHTLVPGAEGLKIIKKGPGVLLVPVEQWDLWANMTPIGALWDKADEEEILHRARQLGWEDYPHACGGDDSTL